MSGAVFTLGNSVSGSLSLGSALSKFGRVAGEAGFTIEQDEETLNNTVTSRYAGLAAVTVSGVTSVLNPSLVLIPSAYNTSGSTGILYSLHSKPNGVGDFVVTRATAATRFNSVGKISTVGSGDARLDYYTSGGTVGPPALLVEPSGTNLVVQSQNWLASGWRSDATGNVTTVSATTGTLDPLGTNTANAISPTSGNTSHIKVGSDDAVNFTSGTVYTASAFFKRGTGNAGRYIQIAWPAARFAASGFANFDLELGTVALVTGSNVTAGIENYGNGWYRCRCTNTCISNGLNNGISMPLIETSGATRLPVFTGTTTDVLYGWGAQTETGSIATSYIPTTTASATRNADVITLSGAGSGCIGQTEGTIYWEGESLASGAQDIISINQSNTNSVAITKFTTNVYRCVVIASGTTLILDDTVVKTGFVKIAFAYKSGDTALFINGAQVGSTNTTVFTFSDALSSLIFGPGAYYSGRPDQKCRTVALYSTRLTNAQLAALTT
jgi:hypothetical protein